MPNGDRLRAVIHPNNHRLIIVIGIVLVALNLVLATLGDLTRVVPRFLLLYGLMFIAYAASVYLFVRIGSAPRGMLAFVFVVAAACRLVNLPATPSLSDDIYRYLWEGRVIQAGHNPFEHPPSAPELAFLRDENYEKINHKELETIYPPVAQAVFYLGAFIRPTIGMQKLLFVLFDLASMVLIALLLRTRGESPCLSAVYGWSPLVLVEFSHSGHMDSLGIFLLLTAALFFVKDRRVPGVVAVSFSILAKYLAALLVPFLVLKKRYALRSLVIVPVIVLAYLPFARAGSGLASSLGVYGRHWDFNSLPFTLLHGAFDNGDLIRLVLAAALAAFALYQGARCRDLLRFAYLVFACSLLLSPTVYPWYVCWIVPFLCFNRSRAWLFFTGAVAGAYWVWVRFHATGEWGVGTGVMFLEYLPFYALLAYEGLRTARKASTQ